MKCSNCNSEVKKGDKKCAKCGATLIWDNKQKEANKKPVVKSPISTVFILPTASLFFFFLITSIYLANENHSYNFIQAISITFIVFTSICAIAFFSLIFINKKVDKGRMKNFIIALGVVIALLIIFSTLFATSRNPYQSANEFFKEKYYENAIEYYQIVIEKNKDSEQVAYSAQKVAEAEDFIEEAKMFIAKGDTYLGSRQFEVALAEYGKALEIYPYLSGINEKISNTNERLKIQIEAEAQKREKINSALEEGNNLYQKKEYDKSLDKFNEALNLDSGNKEAEEKIGIIKDIILEVEEMLREGDESFKEKEYQKALFIYEQVEDLYPNYKQVELKISQCEGALEEEKKPEVIENTVGEEQKEVKVVEEIEDVFSFDEYINTSKVREYKMVEEEDIKIKALGDKLFSEYTTEELNKLPFNYRLKCLITIPRDITEEELESTFAQIIKDKSTKNLEIDEIYIAAWYFEESVGKTVSMGRAEWCPNGEWAELPPEIAESNVRDSYKIVFYIEIQENTDELIFGLTESERMQAFYELVAYQDSIPWDDPEWDEKNDGSYAIIAEKYGITRSQMYKIGFEGSTKGWPMPPLE